MRTIECFLKTVEGENSSIFRYLRLAFAAVGCLNVGLPAFAQATATVSVSSGHALALKQDGTVWSWGYNGYGQLGDGTFVSRGQPQQVPTLTNVVAIAAASNHSMALKSDGTVWTWGANNYGQIGDGTQWGYVPSPVQITALSGVVSIAAGTNYSVAAKSDGTVWSWGYNYDWQLGDGTRTTRLVPTAASGLTGVSKVAAGGTHSVALKTNGTVWAWGLGSYTSSVSVPTQVSGLTGVTATAAGNNFSIALKSDGTVWSWGSNSGGQLGDGTQFNRNVPVQTSGLTNVVYISTGFSHALAVKSDGSLWSWGHNSEGVLGDGTTINRLTPVQATGLSNVAVVDGSSYTSVAVKTDGTVLTWGYLLLATSARAGRSMTLPVQTIPLTNLVSAAVGPGANAVLKEDGTVWRWGSTWHDALHGSAEQVSGVGDIRMVKIAKNDNDGPDYGVHVVAVKDDGTVWSWGLNLEGAMGDGSLGGTYEYSSLPVQASGVTSVAAAAAGGFHTVALRFDGTLLSWGLNWFGQLGDNTNTSRYTAVPVSGIAAVQEVAAGKYHTVALKNDGTARAWGANWYGALGDGTFTDRKVPTAVSGLTDIRAIAAGAFHTLALKNDGTVWAWGANWYGALGDGSYSDSNIPIQVPGLTGVIHIVAGTYHSLAVKNDGTVWAWGRSHNELAPAQITGIDHPLAVAGSDNSNVAILRDGTMRHWGGNDYSELLRLTPAPIAIRLSSSTGDTDQDGIDDTWEMEHFGDLLRNGTLDADSDGLADIDEYSKGGYPNNQNADGDLLTDLVDSYPGDYYNAVVPTLAIVGGNNQSAAPSTFNPQPFVLWVRNTGGTEPLANAPVALSVTQGGGMLALSNVGNPPLSASLLLQTDQGGNVQVYYKHPNTAGVSSQIAASAGNAAPVVFTTTSQFAGVPPSISSQPTNTTVNQSQTAYFTVVATGTPNPTYQWRKGGTNLGGATSATLTITNVQADNAGSYDVIVTNSAGMATSAAATLTVNIPPSIVTPPSNTTVTQGQTATLTVVATGTPAPTYQWRKGGANISGATSPTLSLVNAQASHAGSYDVVITNSVSTVTSGTATLTVNVPPSITTQPLGMTVDAGQTASFTVVASGIPSPTYQWRKSGINVSGATAATLTITNVQSSNAGNYDVVVSNSVGNVTSTAATLTVNTAPLITAHPQSQTVTIGGPTTFSLTATGTPSPSYQWRKNGVSIAGATSASYAITNTQLAHAGSYTVVATNTVGSATSNAATLTVIDPATIPLEIHRPQ